jgi:hypothetical protein
MRRTKRSGLVRAREDAKQDQLRRAASTGQVSSAPRKTAGRLDEGLDREIMEWRQRQVHFEIAALEATWLDYVHEVSHHPERIAELGKGIDTAMAAAPSQMRAVIQALPALRGVAQITAVTIVAAVGWFSRLGTPAVADGL